MIYSRSKQQDIQNRANMLEAMKIALRHGLTEAARGIGKASTTLKEKLATHDYSKDETFDEIWKRRVNEGCDRNGIPRIY